MARSTIAARRGGFTLIELLVVISIVLVVSAGVMLLMPALNKVDRSQRAASQVQSWLWIARQQALRDRRPVGVELIPGSLEVTTPELDPVGNPLPFGNANGTDQMRFVTQPDDYVFRAGTTLDFIQAPAGSGNWIARVRQGTAVEPTYLSELQTAIQPGDWLTFPSKPSGNRYRMLQVTVRDGSDPVNTQARILFPPQPTDPNAARVPDFTADYTGTSFVTAPVDRALVVRQPRPMTGEDLLRMPTSTGVHFARSMFGPDGSRFVFSPSGSLVGQSFGKVVLWVYDTESQGPPSLIAVNARTGQVTAHPVFGDPNDITPVSQANWYNYTRDGKSSGN